MPETAASSPKSPSSRPAGGGATPPAASLLSWILPAIFLAGAWAYQAHASKTDDATEIRYSDLYSLLDSGKIDSVTLTGLQVRGKLKSTETVDGHSITTFRSLLPAIDDRGLLPLLRDKSVAVTVKSEEPSPLISILSSVLPWVLILGAWVWMSRRAASAMTSGPMGRLLAGRQSRVDTAARVTTKFDEVAGLKSAKRDLREIVDFLKSPAEFRRLGGKVPRGILLVGPPGTGKTLLARAVAGEAGVPFFSVSASEFIELFVGMGAKRVRDLFEQAKQVSPSIVFIDEIDAVGRSRGTGLGGGNDEREQTLNQLLSEMDGFTRNDLTIVIAATNRPDVLDPALLRPGRFDRRVTVDRPELAARKAILGVHTRDKPLGPDVDLGVVAALTAGFSGADLANLANEAALGATRRKADAIAANDFAAAYDKIVLGDPREAKLEPAERERVAVHESGHAVTAYFERFAEPPSRVSIIPRGMALGVTQQTPGVDRHLLTQPELEARLRVLMGGYAAEALVLGTISSGASDDLRKATEIAFEMAGHYGMSERLGPVFHEHRTSHPFLGQQLALEGSTSDATVHAIEQETRRMLSEALAATRKLLTANRGALDALVRALLDHETLERDDLDRYLHGGGASNGAEVSVPGAVVGTEGRISSTG
ncbi:MAG TPA: ATP-dependent zinc metalloprotease FtsH [Polyangiaceae bacterium]|jgi:cell division protease FtsH|nr:ATP-dependent zinc metalloprotease FtsH [Polyangiaceae bacterium]